MFSIKNYIILFLILITLGFFYRRFEDKRIKEEDKENYDTIRKYLLNDTSLANGDYSLTNTKKPILWIHVPYEYNARDWQSFGSRSSFDLNQPYLYLTVKSIISQCKEDFHICLIDDDSFKKLIPDWSIDMKTLANPVKEKIRKLGLANLLSIYGGIITPISFLCTRNLISMYEDGVRGDKMFVVENINRNVSADKHLFYPDITFMGAPKDNETVKHLVNFMQSTISRDFTAESCLLGEFNKWCYTRVKSGEITMISGIYIGTKNLEDQPINIEMLLGQNYIDLYPKAYGIYIPAKEILSRRQYEWFARLSATQVLQANTILSKYILLANAPDAPNGVIEPLEMRPNWVGFWKVPLDAPVYGMRPLGLGDKRVQKLQYPDN